MHITKNSFYSKYFQVTSLWIYTFKTANRDIHVFNFIRSYVENYINLENKRLHYPYLSKDFSIFEPDGVV